jgi:hypothetical protein
MTLQIKKRFRAMQVAHTCNPSYSRGRDQEVYSSKPARANSSRDPVLKKLLTQKGWWSGPSGKSACQASVRP